MKLSFKKQPLETGRAGVGYPHPYVDIKADKKVIGTILPQSWCQDFWRIQLRVVKKDIMEDGNPNCTWKNITLKFEGNSEEEAREFLKNNWDLLQEIYVFHILEDE